MSKPAGGPPPDATRQTAQRLRRTAGRTVSQQRWLTRQLNDPYVTRARKDGYRSRAAFKLIELDDRFRLIRPGARILDLGAAPGGWCQVAIRRGARHVAGVDLLAIDPVPGATLLQGDIAEPDIEARLRDALGGAPDLVLSDMAPNTTGHQATDHIRIVGLAELACEIALANLAENGAFVAKVFQGGAERALLDRLKRAFGTVRHAKPEASRKESSELYVVATGFSRARAQTAR